MFWRDESYVIEVKIRRRPSTEEKALGQIARYLDGRGLDEGWLVLFDPRKSVDWTEKIFLKDVQHRNKTVHIVGC